MYVALRSWAMEAKEKGEGQKSAALQRALNKRCHICMCIYYVSFLLFRSI